VNESFLPDRSTRFTLLDSLHWANLFFSYGNLIHKIGMSLAFACATSSTPVFPESEHMQVAGPARRLAGGILGLIAGLLITSPTFVNTFSTRITALGLIPVLTIFTPFQNQTVSGTVPFYVQADSIGTVSLQFKIDGQDFGTAITAGSCRAKWDSTQTGDGFTPFKQWAWTSSATPPCRSR
jgi:hypothetical protein